MCFNLNKEKFKNQYNKTTKLTGALLLTDFRAISLKLPL